MLSQEELAQTAQELRDNKRSQNTRDIQRILRKLEFTQDRKNAGAVFWTHPGYPTFHFSETDPVDPKTAADLAKLIDQIAGKTNGQEDNISLKEPFEFKNGLADLAERFDAHTLDGIMTLSLKGQPYIAQSFEVEGINDLNTFMRRSAEELTKQSNYLAQMIDEAKEKFHIEVNQDGNAVRVSQPELNITPIEVEKNSGYIGGLMQALNSATKQAEEISEQRFYMPLGLEEIGFKTSFDKKSDWESAQEQPLQMYGRDIVIPYYGESILTLDTVKAIEKLIEKSQEEARQLETRPQIAPFQEPSTASPTTPESPVTQHEELLPVHVPLSAVLASPPHESTNQAEGIYPPTETPKQDIPLPLIPEPETAWQRQVRPESIVETSKTGSEDIGAKPPKRAYTPRVKESPVNAIDETSFGWRMTVHRHERKWTESRLAQAVQELLERPVAQVNLEHIFNWSQGLAVPTEKEFKALSQILIMENDKVIDKDAALTAFENAYHTAAHELNLPYDRQSRRGVMEFSRQLFTLRNEYKIIEDDLISKVNDKLMGSPITPDEEKFLKADPYFIARIERGAFDPSPGLASAIIRAFDEVSLVADRRPIRLSENDKSRLQEAYDNRPAASILEKTDEYTSELRALRQKMQSYFTNASGDILTQTELAERLNERLQPGETAFPNNYLGDLIGSARKQQLPKFRNNRLVRALHDYLSDKSGREQADAFVEDTKNYYTSVEERRKEINSDITR